MAPTATANSKQTNFSQINVSEISHKRPIYLSSYYLILAYLMSSLQEKITRDDKIWGKSLKRQSKHQNQTMAETLE